jgi:hypothetical protein
VRVGVGVQLLGDLVGQHVDLHDQRLQNAQARWQREPEPRREKGEPRSAANR